MEVGKVFSLQEFREHTKDEDFEGVTVLTIEQEKKVVKISDYIASTIADLGVRHVFGVCGGGAMHLVDSFGGSDRLEYIATHHEQAAAMAAEGYARISGVPGATLVTSGPGGTNAITGVYGAWVDSIPAIFVSGQVTRDTLDRPDRSAPVRNPGREYHRRRPADHEIRGGDHRSSDDPLPRGEGLPSGDDRPARPGLDRCPAGRPEQAHQPRGTSRVHPRGAFATLHCSHAERPRGRVRRDADARRRDPS